MDRKREGRFGVGTVLVPQRLESDSLMTPAQPRVSGWDFWGAASGLPEPVTPITLSGRIAELECKRIGHARTRMGGTTAAVLLRTEDMRCGDVSCGKSRQGSPQVTNQSSDLHGASHTGIRAGRPPSARLCKRVRRTALTESFTRETCMHRSGVAHHWKPGGCLATKGGERIGPFARLAESELLATGFGQMQKCQAMA